MTLFNNKFQNVDGSAHGVREIYWQFPILALGEAKCAHCFWVMIDAHRCFNQETCELSTVNAVHVLSAGYWKVDSDFPF